MLPAWTKDLTLATRFALAGGVVLVLSAALIGQFSARRIEAAVVRSTADATALFMDSVIAPLGQELSEENDLSPGARRAVSELLSGTPLGQRVISYKLRNRDGVLVAASDASLIGRDFGLSGAVARALRGEVIATFEDLHDEEDSAEAALGLPLLEIYSPIRAAWSGEVIGVAEFYEVATGLANDIAEARRNVWTAVVLVLGCIGGALYLIVLQGSRTIVRQQGELARQLADLRAMSDHNTQLRLRIQQAAARATAMNETALRGIGADLHDGPAQYMGYAALRLDSLRALAPGEAAQREIDAVMTSVQDAIREIRQISRGLALPDIENRSPCEILRSVAEAHMARTGVAVAIDCSLPADLPLDPARRICLYRFAQEGLTNAWRHGQGSDTSLSAALAEGVISVAVRDRGPGVSSERSEDGMGLAGLRDRVESLGGTVVLRNRDDVPGAELVMEME